MNLRDLLQGLPEAHLAEEIDSAIPFAEVTTDSRSVCRGDLFVALHGVRDGHDFALHAYTQGAFGAILDHPIDLSLAPPNTSHTFAQIIVPDTLAALQSLARYWQRRHGRRVVAITGSVGKTTTKEMVGAVLSQKFAVLRNEKNLNNEIGLPLTVLRMRPEHDLAVLEMGMYEVGEIAALCSIAPPSIGVVTNVGPSHLERLRTIDRIVLAKSELVRALPPDGWAVLNGDDPLVSAMAELSRAPVVLYGFSPKCTVRVVELSSHALEGISFALEYRGQRLSARSPLPGRHAIYPCLAAIAVGFLQGLTWEEIQAGLAVGTLDARLRVVPGRNSSTIIDDTYNASPASMIAALDLLAELSGRRIAVLGDMFELGSYEEQGHREVGTHAASTVDQLIVVGDRAVSIGLAARDAGLRDVIFANAKDEVNPVLQPGDSVLVKGSRGMCMEVIVNRLCLSTDSSAKRVAGGHLAHGTDRQ